jgi:UDP-galactopyranose mutase
MRARFDVLVVGAGLFGATCAHELSRRGLRCLVVERRTHIGGNCYSERRDGIQVHMFGPHIFHTSDERIWNWINRFSPFNQYRHRVKSSYQGKLYSFPPCLHTFRELWGIASEAEAHAHLERVRVREADPASVEGWALSQLGSELFEKFIKGYTLKQWGKPAVDLPAAILRRLPVRFTWDDGYYDDTYQGIPTLGYTAIFEKLLEDSELRLSTDYFDHRSMLDACANRIVYTGPIDRFFDHRFGRLEYRGVRLEHRRLEVPSFQGTSIVNYPEENVPFTRIIEHKHFDWPGDLPHTWITREHPAFSGAELEPMYPIRDTPNCNLFGRYAVLAASLECRDYYFGGRLAEYQYYDMHQVIASALKTVERIVAEIARPNGSRYDANRWPSPITCEPSWLRRRPRD